MNFEFLGTGTSFGVPQVGCACDVCTSPDPHDQRLRSSIWIHDDSLSLVVDTGPDFRTQCLRSGIVSLDTVIYTHFHADHIFGVDDIRVYNYIQKTAIPVYLPDFMVADFERCFPYTLTEPGVGLTRPRFELITVRNEALSLRGVTVLPVDGHHGEGPVKGYIFSAGSGRIAYLTDCKTLPEQTIAQVQGADVVVLSALWKLDKTHPSHMNLDEALALAERLGGGKTYLTHLTHKIGRHGDSPAILPPNVYLAHDGLVLPM